MIQRLYSAQAHGEITFTLTYLLQLRLCFGELPYQLRIRFVPGSVPFEESEKHPCVQEMFFSHGNKQRILSWTSRLQECSALVESLVCKHFSTFLIPNSLHWAEHLVCKNVQPWLRVSFASTSQPSLYLVPYTCLVLTVASWPADRFLKRQVSSSGISISLRIFHSLLWSTQSKTLA